MKKKVTLCEAVKLCDMFEFHRSLIYNKLPLEAAWEIQQFWDIMKQMKHLWTETVTAQVPNYLFKSKKPEDENVVLSMMGDISVMELPIITPDQSLREAVEKALSEEEMALLQPLWDIIDKEGCDG